MELTSDLFKKVKAEIDAAPGETQSERMKLVLDEFQIKELFHRIGSGPVPGHRYSHYKQWHPYEIVINCVDEDTHLHLVVYRDLLNPERVWARSFESFRETIRMDSGVYPRFVPLPMGAKVVTARSEYEPEPYDVKVFLAGGITNCPDWQSLMIEYLMDETVTLFNPRCEDWNINDADVEAQITWEHKYLEKADAVSFWFCKETLCPITLFELGKALMGFRDVFIGCDPEYARKLDVVVQTRLERPNIQVVYSLTELADQVRAYVRQEQSRTYSN